MLGNESGHDDLVGECRVHGIRLLADCRRELIEGPDRENAITYHRDSLGGRFLWVQSDDFLGLIDGDLRQSLHRLGDVLQRRLFCFSGSGDEH